MNNSINSDYRLKQGSFRKVWKQLETVEQPVKAEIMVIHGGL